MTDTLTFKNTDKFQRKDFCDDLTRVITSFHRFYSEAFVLSLNAPYGSGKTTFLKMWQAELVTKDYKVIYINAWETDFDNQPLIPIVSSLLDAIRVENGAKEKIMGALKGVLVATSIGVNGVIESATGMDLRGSFVELHNELTGDDLNKMADDIYESYSFKRKAYETLKIELSDYVSTLGNKPLIIFVDELDRVRPNYAVEFLEAIKHIFSVKGICFVFAVDKRQLKISIQQLYGDIDFENYYRRFISREANLPNLEASNLQPYLKFLSEDFFDAKMAGGVSFAFPDNQQQSIIDFIGDICHSFKFTPRQIESYFRSFCQFMAVESDKHIPKQWVEAASILVAIMIFDEAFYKKLGIGLARPKEIVDFIDRLNNDAPGGIEKHDLLRLMLGFNFNVRDGGLASETVHVIQQAYPEFVTNNNGIDVQDTIRNLINYCNGDRYAQASRVSKFEKIYQSFEKWSMLVK